MKYCRKCQQDKPTSAFAKNKKASDGLTTWCQTCTTQANKIARANPENKERYQQYSWTQSLRKYGLTVDRYKAMLSSQDDGCAICGVKKPLHSKHQFFHVDHCHETGKVRALLCNPCNLGLGAFKDSIGRLKRAIAYLEYFNG